MLPRLCLGWERTMETNPIYTSSGCPNNVDNSKQILPQICKDLHISNRICFERETPNRVTLTTNRIQKQSLLHVLTYGLDGRCFSTTACGEVNESRTVNQPPLSTKEKRVSKQCQQKKSCTESLKKVQTRCWTYLHEPKHNACYFEVNSNVTLHRYYCLHSYNLTNFFFS